MGIFSSIISAVAPMLLGGLMGGKSSPSLQAGLGLEDSQGITSVLGGQAPPPMSSGTKEGGVTSTIDDTIKGLLPDLIGKVGQTGIQSLLGPMQGRMAGKKGRAMLDASFPELNAWEKAGANASGMLGNVSGQTVQQKLQEKQQKHESNMQKRQLDTTERIADKQMSNSQMVSQIQAQAQLGAAGIHIQPQMAQLPAIIRNYEAMSENQLFQAASNAARAEGIWIENRQKVTKSMQAALTRYKYNENTKELFQNVGIALAGSAQEAVKYGGALLLGRRALTGGMLGNKSAPVDGPMKSNLGPQNQHKKSPINNQVIE